VIGVVGGTGTIGRALLDELAARGAPARVLVRDDEKAKAVSEKGFEPVRADLADRASLEQVFAGCDGVFLCSGQHPQQTELQGNAVGAARSAGVARIAKVSGGDAITRHDGPSWAGRAHATTEDQIRDSGLGWTFLRPTYFFQNMLPAAERIRDGVLPLALDGAKVAWVDARDVGAVAAVVLTSGDYDGKVLSPSGPESLTAAEVAQRLSEAYGREIVFPDPPVSAAIEALQARGAPDWLQEHVGQILEVVRSGAGAATTTAVQDVVGRPPRSVDDFARDFASVLNG
jgi:uncharacterized protein YbjT (DUF2867 family)